MPSILIISHNEICYNARLLKAADFFQEKGWEVTVFNGVTGIASREVYEDVKQSRSWKIIENDISKNTLTSRLKWIINGIFHKLVRISVDQFNLGFWRKYYLNKTLILAPNLKRKKYDYILIHLVDNLPFAVQLKKKTKAKIIYDNQEYFVGQFSKFELNKYKWVKAVQERYIKEVDVLLATTNVMLERLRSDYHLTIPSFRVRNVPMLPEIGEESAQKSNEHEALKLVWHGMGVYFNNRRGVHILLQAIAECKEKVHLYLQGNLNETQKAIFDAYDQQLGLASKVTFLPSSHPDRIVESLKGYDVGLTAELPEELNQELTSSNKLFDYIHAGLAVISSNTLGLAETINEFKTGFIYEPGNSKELSEKIDQLASNRDELSAIKENSMKASKELYWAKDYDKVLEAL